jgi:D-amino peptidase
MHFLLFLRKLPAMNQKIKIRIFVNLIICLLPVFIPARAQTVNSAGFSVYIFADMEGCSGLTNRDQILTEEGPLRMADDMNACIAACFEAGATKVVVRDGHGGGKNVDPQLIDKRAQLIQGPTPGVRYKGLEDCEAVILLGYHAKAQTPAAIMAHSYSSATIQSMFLNGKAIGEIGVDAAIAAEHKVPVVMVSGDDKTCLEAAAWIPGVVTCRVKTATSASSGTCLSLEEAHALIATITKEALSNRKSIPLIRVNYPATLKWEYIPKDSPRVYAADFKPFPDPKTKELTSGSVEKMLLGD